MMKQLLFIGTLALFSVSIQAQSVKAKLGSGGKFLILDSGDPNVSLPDPDAEKIKLLISELGEVNWYLDGQDMFIRESGFNYDGVNTADYDFLQIDGTNGRIGFNMLSNSTNVSDNTALTSSVFLNGSIATKVRLLTGTNNYAIKQDDHTLIIDMSTSTGDALMVLPAVADSKGRQIVFKRNGAKTNKVVITAQGSELLNGSTGDVTLNNDNAATTVVCDQSGWWTLTELGAQTDRLKINSSPTGTLDDEEVIEVNFTSANQTVDVKLPTASDFQDKRYVIKRNANSTLFTGNVLRVIPQTGGEKLDQFTNANPYLMVNDYESVTVESNGTQWWIVSNYEASENAVEAPYNVIGGGPTTTVSLADQVLICSVNVNSGSNATIELNANAPTGKTYTFKVLFTALGGTVTIVAPSGQLLESGASVVLVEKEFVTVIKANATAWQVIGHGVGY
jgi:hypothetical protein